MATLFFATNSERAKKFIWIADMFGGLDPAVSQRWVSACEQREAFKDPTLYIPDIRTLAKEPDGTIQHLARLVLQIHPSIRVPVAPEYLATIRSVAKG